MVGYKNGKNGIMALKGKTFRKSPTRRYESMAALALFLVSYFVV